MISAEDIKNIVASGEGFNAEFKVRPPAKAREITEEVCAFANAAGGVVLIGVNDKNQIVGSSISNDKRSGIQNSIDQINPGVRCDIFMVKVDDQDVWVIQVPSGPKKPYIFSGSIFVRNGPNSQKLTTAEEMRDFFQQSDRIYFDEGTCHDFDPESEIHEENFIVFKRMAKLSMGIPNQQVFSNLRLFSQEGKFKNGSVLFFATEPQRQIETAIVRCIEFEGTDKRYILDDKTIAGPLYLQFLGTIEWLKKKLNLSYDIEGAGSGPRIENWEIPLTAFKEAIINALSHRDYYEKGSSITIEVFYDRVEISNPGGLVSGISPRDFGKRSLSRNPLIFGLFEKMHMVEKIGSGINRMHNLLIEADLPEPEFKHEGMFTVIFRRPIAFSDWLKMWEKHLNKSRKQILKAIKGNLRITISEMAKKLRLSETSIEKHIRSLKKLGLLQRIGTKGGRWKLVYKKPG